MEQKKKLGIAGLIVIPICNFYLLEAYTHNGIKEVRPYSQLFNILLFELLAWMLFFLLRNSVWALRIETGIAMIAGLFNYYVYTFRSMPLVPWDIFSIKTGASVMGNYDYTPTPRIVIVAASFLLLLIGERFLDFSLEKWKQRQSLIVFLGLAIVVCGFSHVLQQEDFQNKHRMYNKLFTPVFMWQVNGFVLTFVMELPFVTVEKPAGYSKEQAERMLGEYENKREDVREDGARPSIIVVMDEAFSDLSVLGEFHASEGYMPNFYEMQHNGTNRLTGLLNVSVCGGNTANTEFEFLTGNTMAFLPQGSIPYQQYIKTETEAIPAYLKTLGYETYGMHPYYAEGWERDRVYPLFGFDHLLFLPDFQPAFYVRSYVSDKTCVDKIIETYENRNAPAFIFTVTMQNHGGYTGVYDDFTPHITVEGKDSYALSSYLSLIQETDKAFGELIDYFSKEEEPVMIVFFGDHQPNDTAAEPILELNGTTYKTLSKQMGDKRYQVPYIVWSNFPMENESKDLSANFLAGEVLERAGLPLPAYHTFLQELSQEYPVVSARRIVDDKGNTVQKKDFGEKLKQYEKLQYYQLFD